MTIKFVRFWRILKNIGWPKIKTAKMQGHLVVLIELLRLRFAPSLKF